jgi:ribonuclease PH
MELLSKRGRTNGTIAGEERRTSVIFKVGKTEIFCVLTGVRKMESEDN